MAAVTPRSWPLSCTKAEGTPKDCAIGSQQTPTAGQSSQLGAVAGTKWRAPSGEARASLDLHLISGHLPWAQLWLPAADRGLVREACRRRLPEWPAPWSSRNLRAARTRQDRLAPGCACTPRSVLALDARQLQQASAAVCGARVASLLVLRTARPRPDAPSVPAVWQGHACRPLMQGSRRLSKLCRPAHGCHGAAHRGKRLGRLPCPAVGTGCPVSRASSSGR